MCAAGKGSPHPSPRCRCRGESGHRACSGKARASPAPFWPPGPPRAVVGAVTPPQQMPGPGKVRRGPQLGSLRPRERRECWPQGQTRLEQTPALLPHPPHPTLTSSPAPRPPVLPWRMGLLGGSAQVLSRVLSRSRAWTRAGPSGAAARAPRAPSQGPPAPGSPGLGPQPRLSPAFDGPAPVSVERPEAPWPQCLGSPHPADPLEWTPGLGDPQPSLGPGEGPWAGPSREGPWLTAQYRRADLPLVNGSLCYNVQHKLKN